MDSAILSSILSFFFISFLGLSILDELYRHGASSSAAAAVDGLREREADEDEEVEIQRILLSDLGRSPRLSVYLP